MTDFSATTPIGLIVFDPDAVDAGGPVIVAGAVPDDVDSLDIVTNGKSHRAQVRNHGYLYELPDSRSYPEEVVINRKDGSRRVLTLPDPRPAMRKCSKEAC